MEDAITTKDIEALKKLINANVDLNDASTNRYGECPLLLAIIYNFTQGAIALIEAGADVNVENCFGVTPLHHVCHTGSVECMNALIAKGAYLEAKTRIVKCTPLHYACRVSNMDMVIILIEAGADVNARTGDGRRPRDLTDNAEIIEFLDSIGGGCSTKAAASVE